MIIQLILFVASIIMYCRAPLFMDIENMLVGVLLSFFSVTCYYRNKHNKIGRYPIQHILVFIIPFFIVSFQCDIDYILGFIDADHNYSTTFYDPTVVCKGVWLSSIGITSLFLGSLFFSSRQSIKTDRKKIYAIDYCYSYKFLNITIFVLFVLFVVFVDKNYLMNGYHSGIDMGAVAHYANYLLVSSLMAVFAVGCTKLKSYGGVNFWTFCNKLKFPIVILLLFVVLIILSGRRTEAVRLLLLLMVAYFYVAKYRIRLYKMVVVFVMVSMTFSIVGIARTQSEVSISDASSLVKNEQSISPITKELAGSVQALHIVLSYIPSEREYDCGAIFFLEGASNIPGITEILYSYLGVSNEERNSALLLTSYAVGSDKGGLGTSPIADIYIGFGVVGVVVIMFLFGILLRKCEVMTFNSDILSPYLLGVSFCVFSALVFVARGTVWGCISNMIYMLIFVRLSKRNKLKKAI